ncbi:hypothetical protein L596_006109 [Steinernema carpocapsae]|uniref:Uncharacterized protein n=1 Tax=Steinernema carpocapsae TaxID=34508 RepID=A0A4U8V1C9_STECR|nr:hypothetical protein L596_006109 [Steinernema carpocapsae]
MNHDEDGARTKVRAAGYKDTKHAKTDLSSAYWLSSSLTIQRSRDESLTPDSIFYRQINIASSTGIEPMTFYASAYSLLVSLLTTMP